MTWEVNGSVEERSDLVECRGDVSVARWDATRVEDFETQRAWTVRGADLQLLRRDFGPVSLGRYLNLVDDIAELLLGLVFIAVLLFLVFCLNFSLILVLLLVLLGVVRRRGRGAAVRTTARGSRWAYLTIPDKGDARASEGRRYLNTLASPLERGADLECLARLQVAALKHLRGRRGTRVIATRTVTGLVRRRRGRVGVVTSGSMARLVGRRRRRVRVVATRTARMVRRGRWMLVARWAMGRWVVRTMTWAVVVMLMVVVVVFVMTTFSTVQGEQAIVTVKLGTDDCPETVGGQESNEEDRNAFEPSRKHSTASALASLALLTDAKLDVVLIQGTFCCRGHVDDGFFLLLSGLKGLLLNVDVGSHFRHVCGGE